jgi:hypothetical protein
MNYKQKTNKNRLAKIIFIIFFFLVFLGHWINNSISKNRIKQEFSFTSGRIIDYHSPAGVSTISSVIYCYYVDSNEYRSTISKFENDLIKFEKEDYRLRNKYWVAYNINKPQKSMIYLKSPIDDTKNIPNDLNEFEYSGTCSRKFNLSLFKK